MRQPLDIAVIGGGAAGMAAAMEAARLGARVALIEQRQLLGGAAWHRGRLPGQLLQAAVQKHLSVEQPTGEHGPIELAKLLPNLDATRNARAATCAAALHEHGVLRIHARARLLNRTTIELTTVGGNQHRVEAHAIILATGDRPRSPRGARIDHEAILDMGSMLSSVYLPRSVVVAGAGSSACEMAGLLAHMGCEVTLAVPGDRLLPQRDRILGDTFLATFRAAGGTLRWQHILTHAQRDGRGGARCLLTPTDGSPAIELNPDRVVVATQRKASLRSLGLDTLGIALNGRGYLPVGPKFHTVVPNIQAIGAAIGSGNSPQRARHQAKQAVRFALSPHAVDTTPDRSFVDVVLSVPELATVGMPEDKSTGSIARLVRDADSGLKLVMSAEEQIIGLHAWGAQAASQLEKQAHVVQDGWSLTQLVSSTDPSLARARQAAELLQTDRRSRRPIELDPSDLLAGVIRLPSTGAA